MLLHIMVYNKQRTIDCERIDQFISSLESRVESTVAVDHGSILLRSLVPRVTVQRIIVVLRKVRLTKPPA